MYINNMVVKINNDFHKEKFFGWVKSLDNPSLLEDAETRNYFFNKIQNTFVDDPITVYDWVTSSSFKFSSNLSSEDLLHLKFLFRIFYRTSHHSVCRHTNMYFSFLTSEIFSP